MRVSQANPISMITILYEIALVYLEDAKNAYDKQDRKAFSHALHRAQDTIRQLQASLNTKYEPAPALMNLQKCYDREKYYSQELRNHAGRSHLRELSP